MYVLHIETKVNIKQLEIRGFWTSRSIQIKIDNIVKLRKRRYKKNILRRAVYNLHNLGSIRFYTSGEDFVEITDGQGFVYRIGSQKVDQLHFVLLEELKKRGKKF